MITRLIRKVETYSVKKLDGAWSIAITLQGVTLVFMTNEEPHDLLDKPRLVLEFPSADS